MRFEFNSQLEYKLHGHWVTSFLVHNSRIRPAMLAMRIPFYGTFTDALQTLECHVSVKGIINGNAPNLESAGLLPQPFPLYSKSLLRHLDSLSCVFISIIPYSQNGPVYFFLRFIVSPFSIPLKYSDKLIIDKRVKRKKALWYAVGYIIYSMIKFV